MANSIDAIAYPGTRSSGDYTTNVKPSASYRQGILLFYPNGTPKAPLTALTSKMKQIKVDQHTRSWWEKIIPFQYASVTPNACYTDSNLAVAYGTPATNGAAGKVVFVKMTAAGVKNFRIGHQVAFQLTTDPSLSCQGKVIDVVVNGDSSYISVKLLNADSQTAGKSLASIDLVQVCGNVNPENSELPSGVVYDPTKRTNYLQTFRTSFDLSRRAIQETIRTGDPYQMAKTESMMLHYNEIEWAFLTGVATIGNIGSNGLEETTTMGLKTAIETYVPGNVFNYVGSGYGTWDIGSQRWLDASLEVPFRFGSSRKLAFVGNDVVLGLQRTIRTNTQYHVSGGNIGSYGLYTQALETPFGTVDLYRHPLLCQHPAHRSTMILFEPANLDYLYLQDTMFHPNEPGRNHVDGRKEGWTTDCGLEFHLLEACAMFYGWGQDA